MHGRKRPIRSCKSARRIIKLSKEEKEPHERRNQDNKVVKLTECYHYSLYLFIGRSGVVK